MVDLSLGPGLRMSPAVPRRRPDMLPVIVSTDDAYVRADATTLAAKVAGYVSAIGVEDNERHVACTECMERFCFSWEIAY